MSEQQYYIVDLRREWNGNPYVTFWRPNNSNYAYPIPWAGRYDESVVEKRASYYCILSRQENRFPVPCEAISKYFVEPEPGVVDGDIGPVVKNSPRMRTVLRKLAYVPERAAT